MSKAVKFGSKDDADAVRDEFEEFVCPLNDDRRTKTVHFVDGTPESVVEQIDADESTSRREDSIGQLELTDAERDQIDFSNPRANVPWAQSIKALAQRHGVSDWTSHVDPTLTVDEHRQIMREAGREGGGRRDDSHEDRALERERRAAAVEQDQQCNHARDVCQNGDPEACEFLKTACGFDDGQVNDLLVRADGGIVVDDPADSAPDNADRTLSGREKGALSRSWGGYHGAVDEIEDAVDRLRDAWQDAQQAARSINGIREGVAQEALHFDALEAVQADLLDFLRTAADDCHECHADHSGHDHPVTSGDVESITEAIRQGVASTPVGVDDDADLPPSAELADREPSVDPPDVDSLREAAVRDDPRMDDPEELLDDAPEALRRRRRRLDEAAREVLNDVPSERVRRGVAPKRQLDDAVGGRHADHRNVDRESPEQVQTERERLSRLEGGGPGESDQFADEQQGTLDVGVESEEVAEEKQVTLTGTDESESRGALPPTWNPRGVDRQTGLAHGYEAGPMSINITRDENPPRRYRVLLVGRNEDFQIASGLSDKERAQRVALEFTERVSPDEVSFKSSDPTVQEAAAEALAVTQPDDGGLADFS